MNAFIARNGLRVAEHAESLLGFAIYDGDRNTLDGYSHLNAEEMEALQEFFQHERDTELGRWRWPQNPDYVVYRGVDDSESDDIARVFHEIDGLLVNIARRHVDQRRAVWDEEVSNPHWHAARAYFDAHPERKPWHDAQAGDVWELTHHHAEVHAFMLIENGAGRRFECQAWSFPADSEHIRSGRRIWPETTA